MRTQFGFLPAASLVWTVFLLVQLWLAARAGSGSVHVKETQTFRIFAGSWKLIFAIIGLLWNLAVNGWT